MQRASILAGIVFLVFSLAVVAASLSMEYYSSLGPGPGFFPFWLGLVLTLLSVLWFVQILRGAKALAAKGEIFIPHGEGRLRLAAILGALLIMALLMDTVGFQILMFLMLVFLLSALGRVAPWLTILVAAAGSFGLRFAFASWLDVQLPASTIPFLAALGL